MPELQKQTWVVRYLRIDSEQRRLPCSFPCTVEAVTDGEAKQLAHASFQRFARAEKLNAVFLNSEKL